MWIRDGITVLQKIDLSPRAVMFHGGKEQAGSAPSTVISARSTLRCIFFPNWPLKKSTLQNRGLMIANLKDLSWQWKVAEAFPIFPRLINITQHLFQSQTKILAWLCSPQRKYRGFFDLDYFNGTNIVQTAARTKDAVTSMQQSGTESCTNDFWWTEDLCKIIALAKIKAWIWSEKSERNFPTKLKMLVCVTPMRLWQPTAGNNLSSGRSWGWAWTFSPDMLEGSRKEDCTNKHNYCMMKQREGKLFLSVMKNNLAWKLLWQTSLELPGTKPN